MSQSISDREQTFSKLFHTTAEKYLIGYKKRDSALIDAEGKAFLASIGYPEEELFNFIDDFVCTDGDFMLWYHKAAKEGDVTAQSGLGYKYANGIDVERDYTRAAFWSRKAAEKGDVGAQTCLGYLFANGLGCNQDYAQAAYWYRLAAEQGSDYSQLYLGCQYKFGQGVAKDDAQALSWFHKAATQGNIKAGQELKAMEGPSTPGAK